MQGGAACSPLGGPGVRAILTRTEIDKPSRPASVYQSVKPAGLSADLSADLSAEASAKAEALAQAGDRALRQGAWVFVLRLFFYLC